MSIQRYTGVSAFERTFSIHTRSSIWVVDARLQLINSSVNKVYNSSWHLGEKAHTINTIKRMPTLFLNEEQQCCILQKILTQMYIHGSFFDGFKLKYLSYIITDPIMDFEKSSSKSTSRQPQC